MQLSWFLKTCLDPERNYNHFALRGCKARPGWDVLSHSSSNYYALPYSGHWVRQGEQKQIRVGTSLLLQGLRIHLPMLGKRVQSLVWEDSTCHRATKPMSHNYWACPLQQEKPSLWEACALQLESTPTRRNKRKPAWAAVKTLQPKKKADRVPTLTELTVRNRGQKINKQRNKYIYKCKPLRSTMQETWVSFSTKLKRKEKEAMWRMGVRISQNTHQMRTG